MDNLRSWLAIALPILMSNVVSGQFPTTRVVSGQTFVNIIQTVTMVPPIPTFPTIAPPVIGAFGPQATGNIVQEKCSVIGHQHRKNECLCMNRFKEDMVVTAVIPLASAIPQSANGQFIGYSTAYIAHTTETYLHGTHWGISDTKLTYYPTGTFPGPIETSIPKPAGNKNVADQSCKDESDCYIECYDHVQDQHSKHKKYVKYGIIAGTIGGTALLALLCCIACCCLPRVRRHFRSRHADRKPTMVEQTPQRAPTVAEVREVPTTEPPVVVAAPNESRGTLARQAEEGRGRPSVQFEEAPKVPDEKAPELVPEAPEHVENAGQPVEEIPARPVEEVAAPVEAVHDGARSVTGIAGTGYDISSVRGRKRGRFDGV